MENTHFIIPMEDFTEIMRLIRESYGNDQEQLFENAHEIDLSMLKIKTKSITLDKTSLTELLKIKP